MLSREDYERVIDTFLVELNHLCLGASASQLHAMPRFVRDMDSYLADLRDPERDAAQLLYTAFAFLDEYIGADKERVVAAGYEAYKIAQAADGDH